MPIKPEEINGSKLPTAMRGYQREAVDEFLLRVAWDYRQATRANEGWSKEEQELKARIEELEGQLAAQAEQFQRLQVAQQERFDQELEARTKALSEEPAKLRQELDRHREAAKESEDREEVTRALLATAQRAVRELREQTQAECDALIEAAKRRAEEIETEALSSVRNSADEIERLKQLEGDLKDQLRRTLEAVIGRDGALEPEPSEQPADEPAAAVD